MFFISNWMLISLILFSFHDSGNCSDDGKIFIDIFNISYCQHENEIYIHCRFVEEISSIGPYTCSYVNIDASSNYFLKISKSKLMKFSDKMLNCGDYIKILQLSSNHIQHVKFTNMTSLEELNLSNNELSGLSVMDFSGLVALNKLDLSNNSLTRFDDVLLMNSEIKQLYLSNNKISSIVLNYSPLELLDLSRNEIKQISTEFFFEIKNLTYLDLSHNKISDLIYGTFDQLIKLEYLDLSCNKLTSISQYYFHSLLALRELNVSYNEIKTIDFPPLTFLSKIGLNGNKLNCESLLNFILYLHNSNITINPGNFKSGSNIFGISCTKLGTTKQPYLSDSNNSEILLISNAFILAVLSICTVILIYIMYNVWKVKRSSKFQYFKRKAFVKGEASEGHIYNDLTFEK